MAVEAQNKWNADKGGVCVQGDSSQRVKLEGECRI